MKRSNLLILFIGVAIIFFGCTKDDAVAPDRSQNNQETSLKASKILFAGTSNMVAPGDEGTTTILPNGNIMIKGQTAVWYDAAFLDEGGGDCWEVTGISNWTVNWLITGENTAKVWGKCEILVGTHPDFPEYEQIGKWDITWHGYQTPAEGGGFVVVCDANGQGKEGDVKGMTGKWTYTLDIANGFFYATDGYIK